MKRRTKRILQIITVCAALFVLALGYAYFIEPLRLVVNQQTLTIKDWDTALDGFKIVAIGDIHGGSNAVDEAKLRKIVELTNEQNADLVVLLGDYVSQASSRLYGEHALKMPLKTIAENLAGIKARYGVTVVTGNHDDWYGHDEVSNAFRAVRYTVLDDQIYTIDVGGHKLRILGLMDQLHVGNWSAYSGYLKEVIKTDAGTGPIIVLEHSPDDLPIISGDLLISPDLKLMLAAHTHGGQVWLPLIGSPIVPSSYGQKYAYGHVQENGVDMFVTTGIGTSILPFRFMVPPEIAVLTIKSDR
jgi:uncharacterized protein